MEDAVDGRALVDDGEAPPGLFLEAARIEHGVNPGSIDEGDVCEVEARVAADAIDVLEK